MDEKNTVEISVEEYHALLRTAERVAALERLFNKAQYVSTGDVVAILNICKEGDENEAV